MTTFSFNDADRLINNVIDERFTKLTGSMSGVDVTWGVVSAVASGVASVYLYGDTIASDGFKVDADLTVSVGDSVRVCIDKRGNRWVDGLVSTSSGASPVVASKVTVGNSIFNPGSLELRTDGGSQFIDFSNDLSSDYDARIIYSPALYDEYLRIMGKDLRVTGNIYVDGKLTEVVSSGSRFRTGSGVNAGVASDAAKAIEIYNPSTTTGDAFISFHNPNRYAVHFGLDGSTNELFVGGWSAGAAKSKIWTGANSTPLYQVRFGSVNITVNNGASAGSAAVTWSAMDSTPDIILLSQSTLPGNSGFLVPKTTTTTWSSTGATLYLYTGSGAIQNFGNITAEVRYAAIKFL